MGYKRKTKVPKPFRSMWEYDLSRGLFKGFPYEVVKVPYVIDEMTYSPDWGPFLRKEDGRIIFIETKGAFRNNTLENKGKYKYIKKFLPAEYELIFSFVKPKALLPKCKKLTYEGWADKNGFDYLDAVDISAKVKSGEWVHSPELTEDAIKVFKGVSLLVQATTKPTRRRRRSST